MTAESWLSFFAWVGILGGIAVAVGGIGVWHYSVEVQRQRDEVTETLETRLLETASELEKKTHELAEATQQAKTFATPYVSPPLAKTVEKDVKARVIARLREMVHDGRGPRLTLLHLNMGAQNMERFYRELTSLLDEGGLRHNTITLTGMTATDPPPPYVVHFSADGEERAKQLVDAIRPFVDADVVLRSKPKLPPGTVEVAIEGEPVFRHDGSVVLR